jgi:hypothetical protein
MSLTKFAWLESNVPVLIPKIDGGGSGPIEAKLAAARAAERVWAASAERALETPKPKTSDASTQCKQQTVKRLRDIKLVYRHRFEASEWRGKVTPAGFLTWTLLIRSTRP